MQQIDFPSSIQAPDAVLWNAWHVVADLAALQAGEVFRTTLLGVDLTVSDAPAIIAQGKTVRHTTGYGFLWACLGDPAHDLPAIPEALEPDRCIVTGGSVGVHTSAGRVVENFLDLGHLGYVHTGFLGAAPQTAIAPYRVDPLPEGGIIATGCRVFQPQASPAALDGFEVDYIYKVTAPFTTCLYKANPVDPARWDVIWLFVQPVGHERSIVHPLLLFLADGVDPAGLRWFQQLIFCQDKPILENQVPRRLPLAEGAETSVRADGSSVAYRRYLRGLGIGWGTIAA